MVPASFSSDLVLTWACCCSSLHDNVIITNNYLQMRLDSIIHAKKTARNIPVFFVAKMQYQCFAFWLCGQKESFFCIKSSKVSRWNLSKSYIQSKIGIVLLISATAICKSVCLHSVTGNIYCNKACYKTYIQRLQFSPIKNI